MSLPEFLKEKQAQEEKTGKSKKGDYRQKCLDLLARIKDLSDEKYKDLAHRFQGKLSNENLQKKVIMGYYAQLMSEWKALAPSMPTTQQIKKKVEKVMRPVKQEIQKVKKEVSKEVAKVEKVVKEAKEKVTKKVSKKVAKKTAKKTAKKATPVKGAKKAAAPVKKKTAKKAPAAKKKAPAKKKK